MGAALDANPAVEEPGLRSATSNESSAVRTYRVYADSIFALPQNASAATSVRTHHPRANVALGETLDAIVVVAHALDADSCGVNSYNTGMIDVLGKSLDRVLVVAHALDADSRTRIDPDDASTSRALGKPLDAVVIRIAGVSADPGSSRSIRCADN
ncbi:MAG: hypothetical protein ACRD1K_03385 [Acidimicrobiales bacterium]